MLFLLRVLFGVRQFILVLAASSLLTLAFLLLQLFKLEKAYIISKDPLMAYHYTYSLLRRCELLGFFLLVWLYVGHRRMEVGSFLDYWVRSPSSRLSDAGLIGIRIKERQRYLEFRSRWMVSSVTRQYRCAN